MNHRIKKGRKLSRDLDHRNSLIRNLLTCLVEVGHLTTTTAKAKEIKREFDLLVNLAKRSVRQNNFSMRRKIFSLLTKKSTALKLFDEVLPKFNDRNSGYLSVLKTGVFRDDRAENVLLEFVKAQRTEQKENEDDSKPSLASSRRPRTSVGKAGRKNK